MGYQPRQVLLPQQTPQRSYEHVPWGTFMQSKQAFVPPHTPHTSRTVPLLGMPSHPTQVLLPQHTPHWSTTHSPLGTPLQSRHALRPPQTPHRSRVVPLLGIPSHCVACAANERSVRSAREKEKARVNGVEEWMIRPGRCCCRHTRRRGRWCWGRMGCVCNLNHKERFNKKREGGNLEERGRCLSRCLFRHRRRRGRWFCWNTASHRSRGRCCCRHTPRTGPQTPGRMQRRGSPGTDCCRCRRRSCPPQLQNAESHRILGMCLCHCLLFIGIIGTQTINYPQLNGAG